MLNDDDGESTVVRVSPPGWNSLPLSLAEMTTEECATLIAAPNPVVLLPLGTSEPHGPHLPLGTDHYVTQEVARRAAAELRRSGAAVAIAPGLPYGVTRLSQGFPGAIALSPAVVEQAVRELCGAYRRMGFALVCVLNHHFEPDHLLAVARAVEGSKAALGGCLLADPLEARWSDALPAEFRSGDAHAGAYDTSLVMAARQELVREAVRRMLPPVQASVAKGLRGGKERYSDMGLTRAYAGAPGEASGKQGHELLERLTEMVVTEVLEALPKATVR